MAATSVPLNGHYYRKSTGFAIVRNPVSYLNLRIPMSINTMIANITAPSRPKMIQPIMNATTEPSPSAPQFIDIAICVPPIIQLMQLPYMVN